MSFFQIDLDSGDPTIREWFLIKTKYWPICICAAYIIIAKYVGVWLMKDIRPFNLRMPLIIYNAFLVFSYSYLVVMTLSSLPQTDRKLLCDISEVKSEIIVKLATYAWLCYLLKYIEFLDTLFFILRKKNHLLTNLHIIHHTIIPLVCWLGMRLERSAYQGLPLILNSIVHMIMYTYYGLSAIGPSMQKYLWWKRYITMIQMVQFVLSFLYAVVFSPLIGCYDIKLTNQVNTSITVLFFCLFFNYYYQSFIKKKPKKCT